MTKSPRSLTGLVVAALTAAAGLVGLAGDPATAAVCSSSGITTVVDSGDGAGGGTSTGCDRVSGSRKASQAFAETGVRVRRNPDGSVCQVNGRPAGATCQRLGDQYWALWWSNGKDGSWTYSQLGDGGLTVPAGGSVAWAWQGPSGRRQPGTSPPVIRATPTPKPTPKPTPRPSSRPTPSSHADPTPTRAATTAPDERASTSASTSATPTATASPSPTSTPTASDVTLEPTATPSDQPRAADPVSQESASHSGGLPLWVPATVLVLLGALSGAVLWWRRRGTP